MCLVIWGKRVRWVFSLSSLAVCVWHPRIAVTINGCVDPFHRWGVQASEETASLYVPMCSTHTDSAGRADGPPLTSHTNLPEGVKVTGVRLADRHMFHPKLPWTRDMLSNYSSVFPTLPWSRWENVLHTHSWRDAHYVKLPLTTQLSKLLPSSVSNREDVCIFSPPTPTPWLLLIYFVCDTPELVRHFLGTEQRHSSIFPAA